MSDGGKGSSPRPYSVNQETFANNWDRIFGSKKSVSTEEDKRGDLRINKAGVLEEFKEGYWSEIENRS